MEAGMHFYSKAQKTWRLLLLVLGFALVATAANAQANANLVGTVSDPTGAVVPNAKVTITNQENGFVRTTTTNNTGNYSAPNLPNGNYQVTVEVPGFNTYDRKDIVINVNETVRADAKLQVGNVGQTVTVETNQLQVQSETSDSARRLPVTRSPTFLPTAAMCCSSRPWFRAPPPTCLISIPPAHSSRTAASSSMDSALITTTG